MQKINVYGTGVAAVKFVLGNKDLNIVSFIEGQSKEITEFMVDACSTAIPVVHVDNASSLLKEYFTVIACSPESYWLIKNRLESEFRLIEFENFEYCETFKKKIAVIYGNCHAAAIKDALKQSKVFNNIYGVYPLKAIQDIKRDGGVGLDSLVYERCDLFIHQCIRKQNFYGLEYASENIINKLSLNCKIVGIPNLYRMPKFMYPQMVSNDNAISWEGKIFFPFRDYWVDNNYQTMPIEEIEQVILDDKLILASEILAKQDVFFEELKKREQQWDIKISGFLQDNICDVQLFYDPNHPTNAVIGFIAYKVLDILNIKDDLLNMNAVSRLDGFELPIYATVKSALKLNYEIKYLRDYNGLKLNNNRMDLKEYIRQYIEWNFPDGKIER